MKPALPKQLRISLTVALLALLTSNAQDRDQPGHQNDQLVGGLTGKIVSLHAYTAPTSESGQKEGNIKDTGDIKHPLALVVGHEGKSGGRGDTPNISSDPAELTTTRAPESSEERAFILIFQDPALEEKARSYKAEPKEEGSAGRVVRVTGERRFRGGITTLFVTGIVDAEEIETSLDQEDIDAATDDGADE